LPRRNETENLANLGNAHHTTGNSRAAREVWRQALTVLEEIDHPDADKVRHQLAGLD